MHRRTPHYLARDLVTDHHVLGRRDHYLHLNRLLRHHGAAGSWNIHINNGLRLRSEKLTDFAIVDFWSSAKESVMFRREDDIGSIAGGLDGLLDANQLRLKNLPSSPMTS